MHIDINGKQYQEYYLRVDKFYTSLSLTIYDEDEHTTSAVASDIASWISVSEVDVNLHHTEFDIDVYAFSGTGEERRSDITFEWDGKVTKLYVIQSSKQNAPSPIWKDKYLTFQYNPEIQYIPYKITLNGEAIFNGRAYQMPGKPIYIKLNEVISNYLNNSDIEVILNGGQIEVAENAILNFEVLSLDDTIYYGSFSFIYDWSYEDIDYTSEVSMSKPINGHRDYDGVMKLLNTQYDGSNVFNDEDGEYYTNACGDYALYYLNKFGGWDSFLIEGTVSKSSTVTQYQMNKSFDNNTLEYENKTYLNELVTNYKLNTGWLTDNQSKILSENLLTSTQVYFHDLINDNIIPVVITDTKIENKTYQNQGKKMVNYQINIKESQNKIRR